MRTMNQNRNTPYGDAVLAASRQVWLASLGAAVVSREWAQAEAGNVFRTLVKEGTAVESKAIRIVGEGLEGSFTRANAVWRQTRSTVESTVRQSGRNGRHAGAEEDSALVAEGQAALDAEHFSAGQGQTRREEVGCQDQARRSRRVRRRA